MEKMMKGVRVTEKLCNWRKMILFLCCIMLLSCTDPISIRKPIDISHAGQSVRIDFLVPKKEDYKFSILFEKGDGLEEMNRRLNLIGNIYENGISSPVLLHLVKDGNVYFSKKINAVGSEGGHGFFYERRRYNTAVRNIVILDLPPGRYSATIITQGNIQQFVGIESFIHVLAYKPKI